jgi:hypothetical protein
VLEFDAAQEIADRRGQQIGQRGPNDCRCLAGLRLDPEQIVGPLIGQHMIAHDFETRAQSKRRDTWRAVHDGARCCRNRLSDTIALTIRLGRAMRLGHPLLDFPEHPDKGRTQTNHDNQK